MRKKKELLDVVDEVISVSNCDGTEVVAFNGDTSLTRFSRSFIHQNVAETDTSLTIRVSVNRRYGTATTNVIDSKSIKHAVTMARDIADSQVENPDYVELASPEKVDVVSAWAVENEEQTPEKRAKSVLDVINVAGKEGFECAGSYEIEGLAIVYGNSNGIRLYQPRTKANLKAVVLSNTSEGFAEAGGVSIRDIDSKATAREATDKCSRSQEPITIEPGEYDVILEPYALRELFGWMAYIGFNSKLYHDGRSFLYGKMGEKIWSDSITLIDDGISEDGFPFPFDFEGVPRERVILVENGIAKNLVYDRNMAKKENTKSTGHALPPGSGNGPMPLHMRLTPGVEKVEDLLKKVKKGLWVSNFHYVNGFIDTKNAIFTGMTRYGTFLIEDGELTKPVKNLRFTESMLKAFSSVDGITSGVKKFPNSIGGMLLPTVLIRNFKFTGTTEH